MDDLLVGKDYLLLGNFSEDKKEEEDGKMMVQEEMMGKSEKYMKFLPPRRRRRRRRVKRMYAKDASSLQFVLWQILHFFPSDTSLSLLSILSVKEDRR